MAKKIIVSRRNFLKTTGIAAGAAALSTIALPSAEAAQHASHMNDSGVNLHRARMFFTNTFEFDILSNAAERIFPKDESGPGAIDLAVPYFIDNQLAGAWGYNAREYMAGPFAPGAPTQGPQTALIRRDLFQQGLLAINAAARKQYSKDFSKLKGSEQDEILKLCEAGKLPTEGFTSSYFFSELRNAVLAGAYADPAYNGNNNMDGWRLKEYPGAQMTYIDIIESEKYEKMDPISLASMQ